MKIEKIAGHGVAVEGNGIDTDRIIPARYLKEITFTNMGNYPFYDERFEANGGLKPHPFNEPVHAGASVLFVNQNFGCGSSREHAPQSLLRWGIKAIVGESFAEIFAGNCTMLGVPVVTVPSADIHRLMNLTRSVPATVFTVDLGSMTVTAPGLPAPVPVTMPETRRQALTQGTWDTTAMLMANADKTKTVAARLPYLNEFK